MKNKLISILISFCLALLPIFPAFADGGTVCSQAVCDDSNYSATVKAICGCPGSAEEDDRLQSVITTILNSIIIVSGLVAVIFVIIGGVGYMTSAGDSGKVQKAKQTILYAVIGIVVCTLAYAIVNWTIGVLGS